MTTLDYLLPLTLNYMPKPKTDANKIRELEGKLQEAKSIMMAIQFMQLSETFPEKLNVAITAFLNKNS